MTKNIAPKAPAKPRAKAPAPAPQAEAVTEAPAEEAPRLVLSLHDQIDWNDVGFRFGDDA